MLPHLDGDVRSSAEVAKQPGVDAVELRQVDGDGLAHAHVLHDLKSAVGRAIRHRVQLEATEPVPCRKRAGATEDGLNVRALCQADVDTCRGDGRPGGGEGKVLTRRP